MSDLSNLLGDVYGDASPDGPPVRREPAASERGNESSLDRPFNGWVPGEAPREGDLTEALASVLATPAPAPAPAPQAATLAEAITEIAPARAPWTAPIDLTVEAPAPVREMASVGAGGSWTSGDDDIFPAGKKSKR